MVGRHPQASGPPEGEEPPISGGDTARYTRDLLESLKKMALAQEQLVLAHLLGAAVREAERVIRESRGESNVQATGNRLPVKSRDQTRI